MHIAVLVVEDEPHLRQLFCEALSWQGYEVEGVGSTEQAQEQLATRSFDLLVADCLLQGGRGDALISSVRQRVPELKTMLISCLPDVAQLGRACGADAWCQKGSLRDILDVIRGLLPVAIA